MMKLLENGSYSNDTDTGNKNIRFQLNDESISIDEDDTILSDFFSDDNDFFSDDKGYYSYKDSPRKNKNEKVQNGFYDFNKTIFTNGNKSYNKKSEPSLELLGNEYMLLKEGIQNSSSPSNLALCPVKDKFKLEDDPADKKMEEYESLGARSKPFSIVRINVSGKEYVTLRKTLTFFPDTLLGGAGIEEYYNAKMKAYYFNRHRTIFNSILFFYQSRGIFRAPTNVDPDLVKEELDFFKIDLLEIFNVEDPNDNDKESIATLTIREKVHQFLLDPDYSRAAMVWSFADMIAIVLSIIMLVAESVPSANPHFSDPRKPLYYFFYSIEILVNGFFTVDFLLKLISWPKPWLFFKNVLNFLDFMAILPFYMELIAMMNSGGADAGGKFVVLRICRTSRVVRIFRFVRHSKELMVVMKVVTGASKEFGMLGLLIMIFVLLFGTLLYYCETGQDSKFSSIPESCWWAIVTVTTVGYGDLAPKSTPGRLIGSIAVVLGIIIMALPMTVIVSKFTECYGDVKRQNEQESLGKVRAHAVANGAIY